MASTYHLMRNFIALMRSLGYPRLMSLENFRNPNFSLMADVLTFLLQRFDPSTVIESNVNTEKERINFVARASHTMVNKANLDINVKKLYMADINSVQEMIKLAQLIQDALSFLDIRKKKQNEAIIEEDENEKDLSEGQIFPDLNDSTFSQFNSFKASQITSEIYRVATELYDAIAEHEENKNQLQKTMSKQLNIDQIEATIRKSIQELQQQIVNYQNKKLSLERDNEDLNSKIEKKQSELNRNQIRLQNLYSQRPGYMDELEKIESEIKEFYDNYVTNSRCLFFLEQKLEEFEELERLKIEERNKEIKQMLEQIRIDDFPKNNHRDLGWNNSSVEDQRSSNDELTMIVDIDEDALGRISGSDFSDKDINEIPRNNESRRERKNRNTQKSRSSKKERSLIANTVTVKSLRSPMGNTNDGTTESTTTNRSAKTARIFSYGSLLENEDDDDDSRSEDLANAKTSDSEIDLDAIDDSEDDSINSTEMDYKSDIKIPENGIKISNLNYDKIDDNF